MPLWDGGLSLSVQISAENDVLHLNTLSALLVSYYTAAFVYAGQRVDYFILTSRQIPPIMSAEMKLCNKCETTFLWTAAG